LVLRTLATMACLVDVTLMTLSVFTPLTSSSILPCSKAAFTRISNFLASLAFFFFETEAFGSALMSSASLSASCDKRL
jgi:hypothetical protein